MMRLLHAELLKQRTTRAFGAVAASMLGLVALVSVLHGFALTAGELATREGQMHIFGWAGLGGVFAAVTGAPSFTGELRFGTIRPTLLVSPRRSRLLAAKATAATLLGVMLGVLAGATTLAIGTAALAARGIAVHLSGQDALQLVAGTTAAAAAWALIGVGVGALLRNQVATLTGILAWLLLLEGILFGLLPHQSRFLPGIAGGAMAGATTTGSIRPLLPPAAGALLLVLYAAAALGLAARHLGRSDIA